VRTSGGEIFEARLVATGPDSFTVDAKTNPGGASDPGPRTRYAYGEVEATAFVEPSGNSTRALLLGVLIVGTVLALWGLVAAAYPPPTG
jgi:hypothetical protein